MSRSYRHLPMESYSGPGKTAYKRYLNRRLRHLPDIPSGGAYRRTTYSGYGYEVLRCHCRRGKYFTQQQWDRHVEQCWSFLGAWFCPTVEAVYRHIRRPKAK